MTSIPPRLPISCVFGEVARNFTLEELAVHHRGVRARVHFPSISTFVVIRSRLGLGAQRRGERGDVRRKVWFEEEWDATGQYERNLLDNDGMLYSSTWRGGVQKGLLGHTDWRKGYVRDPVIATSMDNPVQCRFVHSVCPCLPHFSDVADYTPRHWAGRDPYSLLRTCSLGSVGESSLSHHRTVHGRV